MQADWIRVTTSKAREMTTSKKGFSDLKQCLAGDSL